MTEAREMTAEREAPRTAIDLLRLKHPDYRNLSYQEALEYGYIGAARSLDASRAREKALVEALRWYADPDNWRPRGHPQIDADTIPAHTDRGIRARAAFILKPLSECARSAPTEPEAPSDVHPQECGQ